MSAAIDNVLCRLDAVKPAGEAKCPARCPAHDDRAPSLSVGLGAEDRVLLTCFAGCDTDQIVAAIGVTVADLFEGSRNGNGSTPPAKRPKREPEPLPSEEQLGEWQRALLDSAALLARLAVLKGWTAPTLEGFGVGFDGERIIFRFGTPRGASSTWSSTSPTASRSPCNRTHGNTRNPTGRSSR